MWAVYVLAGSVGTLGPICSHGAVPELLGTVPSATRIDSIQVLDSDPNQIVFMEWSEGASCGGGTPVNAWKLEIDPVSGEVSSFSQKQSLALIQNTRNTLFESSDGTLFTGGGWCSFKPAYYSTDGGESWASADVGTYPPNSTFSFAEFGGQVYAGTGYNPYPGEIYRWLGTGSWQQVFSIAAPRTIVETMTAYDGALFAGTRSSGSGGVPVYRSVDGTNFAATTGIPDNIGIWSLIEFDDDLIAVGSPDGSATRSAFEWAGDHWEALAGISLPSRTSPDCPDPVVSADGIWYDFGLLAGDVSPAIYASLDKGSNWIRIATISGPGVWSMDLADDQLYFGTMADGLNNAYVYRVMIPEPGSFIALGVAIIVTAVVGRSRNRRWGRAASVPSGERSAS